MSNINWEARVTRIARAASAATCPGPEAHLTGRHDHGPVPEGVIPSLKSFAHRIGFTVSVTPEHVMKAKAGNAFSQGELYGLTQTSVHGARGGTIDLAKGMSVASTAEVLAHELGHAYRRATESNVSRINSARLSQAGVNALEEVACELGAAAFSEAYNIGTRLMLPCYIAQQLGAHPVIPQSVIRSAAAGAELLHQAVQS